ncbi:NADP-dependent glyceraldehyde-3-phosphate dehydrogenase [Haloimpatiens sp. FM7315]|uniref:NADP-dependent glyceraldehyde-3-phosphate dehydrogenase n=1 Tax=Haloimpatiens sp. FM7315 TaxID=3298609 RepID=UPI0035A3AEE1
MFKEICSNHKAYKNLYNGTWIESSNNLIEIKSPIDGTILGRVQAMEKEDVNKAIKAAKESQIAWKNTPLNQRASILHKASELLKEKAEELSILLQFEIGKNKSSSLSEIKRTSDFIKFTADEGKHIKGETLGGENFPGFSKNKLSFVTRVPLGVVVCISPFNYPINLAASKIAPALVTGNSVVFKPATKGAISGLYLAQIFNKAGVPAGVLNTITGKSSEIGDFLVTHKDINFINFTGSTKTGEHIAKIAGMVPMLMELGGKDPAIVLKDADLKKAAEHIVKGAFNYSGQRCTAIKRVLVIDSIADKLIEKILPLAEKLSVGSPLEDAFITPLIDEKSSDFVESLIEDAVKKGATLLTKNKQSKNLITPVILDRVTSDMQIAWEEPFGPVLPIIRVKDIEEAIKISNASKYGLQASVFTKDINTAFYLSDKLDVGTVQINNEPERGPDHFPFTGVKASGMGTQGIKYSIDAMTRRKTIVFNLDEKTP